MLCYYVTIGSYDLFQHLYEYLEFGPPAAKKKKKKKKKKHTHKHI